jgi:hypothetical protein
MKVLNKIIIGILFSILSWTIIDKLIVELPLWKYIIIEILIITIFKIELILASKFIENDRRE